MFEVVIIHKTILKIGVVSSLHPLAIEIKIDPGNHASVCQSHIFRSKLNPAGGVTVDRADRIMRFACVAV